MGAPEIADIKGLSAATIYRRLKFANIPIRSKAKAQASIRKNKNWSIYNITVPSFDKEDDYYWLGFILADGCIQKSKRSGHSLRISLSLRDKKHLEKCKFWLNSNHPIKSRLNNSSVELRIVCKDLIAELEKFYIIPNKSPISKIHPFLNDKRDFWRGMIDGDGWVTSSRNYTIGLCGTKNVCDQFKEFVSLYVDTSAKSIKSNGIYKIQWTHNIAKKIIKILYYDCNFYLERKYQIAKSLF